jgi:cell division transport system permease protein
MYRKFITFRRLFGVGCKNFVRNAWLSIAATAVMVVTITIVLTAIVLNVTARNAISELSKSLKISVYLKDDGPVDVQQDLKSALVSNPYVSSVEFISREKAKDNFTSSFQNDQQLLDGLALVGGQSLPASYEISVNDIERISEVGDIAKNSSYETVVEEVSLGKTNVKSTIERAGAAQRFVIRTSIIASAVFATVSVLIIFNTIRMAIFTRSEEIRTMKLIGATPNYIRGPFIIETTLYGVIAGLAANAIVYAGVISFGSKLSNQAEFAETYDYFTSSGIMTSMLAGGIFAGILVGMFSSILAMEKYLRLKKW